MLNPRPAIQWSILVEEKKVSIEKVQEVYGNSFNEWVQLYGKIVQIREQMDSYKKSSRLASLINIENLSRDLDNYLVQFDTLPSEAGIGLNQKDFKFYYGRIYNGDQYGEYATFQYKDNYYNVINNQLQIAKIESEEDMWRYNMIDFTEQNMKLIRQFIVNKDEINMVLSLLWFI